MSGKPNPTYLPDCYVYHWPTNGVQITLDRFSEDRQDLVAMCKVEIDDPINGGVLSYAKLNAASAQSQATLTRALNARIGVDDGYDWQAMIGQACLLSIQRWRDGDPLIRLDEVGPRLGSRYLLEPYLELNQPTVLFADGGSGKSLLALAMAVSVATGTDLLAARPAMKGPALYLDWESDEVTHAERLRAICEGADLKLPVEIYYRRQHASLSESAATLRREVARLGVQLVVIDSLGMARGGEPESADNTIRLFVAARSLGCTILGIDHLPKSSLAEKQAPFGSIYTRNAARLLWRVDKAQEEGDDLLSLCLVNTKSNNARLHAKRGIRLHFALDDTGELLVLGFAPTEIRNMREMRDKLNVRDALVELIRANNCEPMTAGELLESAQASGIQASEAVIRATLAKGIDRTFTAIKGGKFIRFALCQVDRELVMST